MVTAVLKSSQIWTVNGFAFELGAVDNFTFDDTGLTTLAVTIANTNGSNPIIANMRLWYRLYTGQQPIMKAERYASLPFSSANPFYTEVRIVLNELIRSIIKTTLPSFATVIPTQDFNYQEHVTLRFGLVSNDADCNEIRTLGSSSAPAYVVNSVHQLTDTRAFGRHCPRFQTGVRFITDRPAVMELCKTAFEWLHIWIENTGLFVSGFRAVFTLYDGTGATIGDQNFTIDEPESAWIIPLHHSLFPSNTARFTMVVQGQVLDNDETTLIWINYSEQVERTYIECKCVAAEIYFLEDHGGFRTVIFKEKLSEVIEMQETTYRLPIDWDDVKFFQYYTEGGTFTVAQEAETVFILQSDRVITEDHRIMYEQLLRSPEVYIKTTNDLGQNIHRRIIFPKNSYQTFKKGNGALKIEIPFRFANKLRVH